VPILGKRDKKKGKPTQLLDWEQNNLNQDWLVPWGLKVEAIEQIDNNRWKLLTERGIKQLNRVYWKPEQLIFVQTLLDHLGQNGFKAIPRFIRTVDGWAWVSSDKAFLFLCDWVEGIKPNLLNRSHLVCATTTLAQLHYHLKGYLPSGHVSCRDNRGQWPGQWQQVYRLIIDQVKRLGNQREFKAFDNVFLNSYNQILNQIEDAMSLLLNSEYDSLIAGLLKQPFVCHNSYREVNLTLTRQGMLYVFGFENCIFDLRIYELGRYLQRVLCLYDWDLAIGQEVLETYEAVWPLEPAERKILLAQLWFPYPSCSYIQAYYQNGSGLFEKTLTFALQKEINLQSAREQCLEWFYNWAC